MHAGTDNYTYLTTAPIRRVIPTMAIPTIISMLVTALYNMADTFFVGKLDTQSTAAVGVVFSLMFFVQATGFFFGHGSGNYISRELGARRHDNAARMAVTGFCFSLLAGTLITVAGWIFLNPLSLLLGATQLRLQGNASFAMVGIVTGAILNVGLDPLFIFVCHWGVAGAALATVTGQVVSFFILFFMTRRGENIAIRFRLFSPSWSAFKEIFFGGSPSLCRQGLLCLATAMLNHAAGNYGDAAIAAMSIVNRITMMVMAVVIGLGQGFQPLCGFCFGARLIPRLKRAYWFTIAVGTTFLIVCTVVGWLLSDHLIGIFRNDAEVIAVGIVALRWQLCSLPLNSMIMTSNMLTQTCRMPVAANLLASARSGLFFIPLILILPHFFGLMGVEMCQAVSDACSFSLTVPVMAHTLRRLRG